MRRTGQTLAVLVVLAFVGGAATAQGLFDAYDLGLPEGWDLAFTGPRAVNNAGQIVGDARSGQGDRALIWYAPGEWEVLPGLEPDRARAARDINEAGVIVGGASVTIGTKSWIRAAMWQGGPGAWACAKLDVLCWNEAQQEWAVMRDFDPEAEDPYPCLDGSLVWAVNDRDPVQLVGWYTIRSWVDPANPWPDPDNPLAGTTTDTYACMWEIGTDGTVTFLDLGTGSAYDVNESGETCGSYPTPAPDGSDFDHAWAWWAEYGWTPLNGVGGTVWGASGINDDGTVVGTCYTSRGYRRACRWPKGAVEPTDLGTAAAKYKCSYAAAINDLGQVIGNSSLADTGLIGGDLDYQATLWTNGQAINLNGALAAPIGSTLGGAMGISNRGWIVGWMGESPYRPFLLVPAGAGANQSPVADAGGLYSAQLGSEISFDGSGSHDPDGDILHFLWDFGDGSPVVDSWPDPTASHTYATAGTYSVTLTVSDDDGAEDSDITAATVSESAGEPGGIGGIVTDAAGAAVKKAAVTAYDDLGQPAAIGKTLPSGAYTLSGLPPGLYTVEAVLGDLSGSVVDVPVVSGQTTTGVDITIQ